MQRGWMIVGCWLVLLVATGPLYASPNLTQLEAAYRSLTSRIQLEQRKRRRLMKKVRQTARHISRLKKEAKRKGILGLPARVRLPGVRAKAQALSRKVQSLDLRLREMRAGQKRLRRRLRRTYLGKIRLLSGRMRRLRGASRKGLQKKIATYRQRLRRLRPRRRTLTLYRSLTITIGPIDGPAEIRQKADVLKDAEDRLRRLLRKIKGQLRRLKKRFHKRRKEDRSLERQVREGVEDDELFSESERNPRLSGGRNLRMNSGQPPPSTPNARRTPAPRPPTRPPARRDQGTPKGVHRTRPPGSRRRHPPKRSAPLSLPPSLRRQHIPALPAPPTLRGSLEKRIKTLQQYARRLSKQLQQIRQYHQRMIRYARQLEQRERRRRQKRHR